ncbi:MAG: hydantoinase/oxoprolinase family protein, partial [Candidatus Thiodiazotropha sp. (ex Lucinoma annulata)]|nr:hydantoinase/oxoprolinase family protein [Candidatus Thiodiazotropha sp. (ex Lucinoma annulata)]
GLIGDLDNGVLDLEFSELAKGGVDDLVREGLHQDQVEADYSMDLRYIGQSYTLNIPWQCLAQAENDFHNLHASRYGHRMQVPVELVNLRVALHGPAATIELPKVPTSQPAEALEWLSLSEVESAVPRYERSKLNEGQLLNGPALITEMASTTWLESGWCCEQDSVGNLLLTNPHSG